MRTLSRTKDARAGLFATVLGLIYLASAFTIDPDPSTTSVVGPRVAPIAIGVAMVVCALALVVQSVRGAQEADDRAHAEAEAATDEGTPPSSGLAGLNQKQVVVSFGIFAAYIVAFIPLGYLLSTFLFLVAMTTYVERRKLVRNCVFAAVFTPAVFVLFNYGLEVQLPSPGLLG